MVAGNSITETNTVPAAARPHTALAFAALVLGAVAMGASPIFVRLADVGPYASAFWRTLLALPLLWLWSRLETRRAARTRFDRSALVAGLLFAGDLFFWHLAIVNTTVANATFLARSEEHTSELQSLRHLVCRLLLEK